MMSSTRSCLARTLMWVGIACAATSLAPSRADAEALLVIDAESGRVLYSQNAGQPWYPASVTKLMTAYVTLRAVKEGRLALDTPLTVSPNAVAQSPVKMGFGVGTVVTVDNALKMLMVKSANDMAVVLAEGVAGSIENFAGEMNANARHLGMIQSSFVNPNGLPADDQVSSARDLAILARALIRELPEYDYYWHLPGIRMGKMVRWNYNTLIGRYPGADGMKTGFICASGFNPVASAARNGRRLIAVVLGAPSSAARAMKAAQLLERGLTAIAPCRGSRRHSALSNRCNRSPPRRPICARTCAAVTASGRRPKTRTMWWPITIPSRLTPSSLQVCVRQRRRAPRHCSSSGSRCSSIPAPSLRRLVRRRRPIPSRRRKRAPPLSLRRQKTKTTRRANPSRPRQSRSAKLRRTRGAPKTAQLRPSRPAIPARRRENPKPPRPRRAQRMGARRPPPPRAMECQQSQSPRRQNPHQ